jgi:RNA polymerase sigma factor (sigma-70 family)
VNTNATAQLNGSYTTLFRELRATFRARGVPLEESNDLAQETILRTIVHLKRHGQDRDDMRPLIHTIARNLLITRVRRRQPELVPLTQDDQITDTNQLPLDKILESEQREAVHAAVRSLSSRHRRVVSLWMEGLTPGQIARELGIKRNAADALLHRARRRLAGALDPSRVTLGLVGPFLLRLRSGLRRLAETVNRLDPQGSMAQASTGLAAIGLVAVLSAAAPASTAPEVKVLPAHGVLIQSVTAGRESGQQVARPHDESGVSVAPPAAGRETDIGVKADGGPGESDDIEAGLIHRRDPEGSRGVAGPMLDGAAEIVCPSAPSICD